MKKHNETMKTKWLIHLSKRLDELSKSESADKVRETLIIGRRLNFISEGQFKRCINELDYDG